MKRSLLMLIVMVAFATTANAQGWLGKLKDKAVDAAKKTIEKNVEEKTEKAVDDAFNGNSTNKKGNKSNSSDNESGKKTKTAKGESVKNDFVAGTIVIFEDNFENEQMGEFPSKWDLIENNVEIGKMNGKKGIKFEHGSNTVITPLIKGGNKEYLPEVYTLEFDYFITGQEDHQSHYRLYCHNKPEQNDEAWDIRVDRNTIWWSIRKPNSDDEVQGSTSVEAIHDQNDWNHFALSFNKRALKVYVNGQRVINIPNAQNVNWFSIATEFWEDHIDYITNVRLAEGAVELYGRNASDMEQHAKPQTAEVNNKKSIEEQMAETGQFVTNNILFKTGKADLETASMIEIMKVADFMKKNPNVRFEVQGHTDNQGSDKINDPLSQKRAETIVKALEELGVDGFNLKAVGKGSHEPIADNSTEVGRALNRRVVFIKK